MKLLSRKKSDESQTRSSRGELAAQLAAPVRRFLATEAGSSGLMLLAVAVALIWANSGWSESYFSPLAHRGVRRGRRRGTGDGPPGTGSTTG